MLDELNQLTQSIVYRGIAAQTKELIGDRDGAERELTAQWLTFRGVAGAPTNARAMWSAYKLALFYADDGRWDDVATCLSYGRDVPEPPGFREETVLRCAAEARLKASRGEIHEALTLAHHAVELADQSDWLNLRARVWRALAEVRLRAGQQAEADAAVATALALYETKGNIAAATSLRR
jgi:hypothetical protein